MVKLTLVDTRITPVAARFQPVIRAQEATAAAPAFADALLARFSHWLARLTPVARDWLQQSGPAGPVPYPAATTLFAPRLALTFLTKTVGNGVAQPEGRPRPAPRHWEQLPNASLMLVDRLLRAGQQRPSLVSAMTTHLERLERRAERVETVQHHSREVVSSRTVAVDGAREALLPTLSPVGRVLRQPPAPPTAPRPAETPATKVDPPGWGQPFTPEWRQAPDRPVNQKLSPGEVNRLTDQVMAQIDRRLQAHRERTGRV